MVVIFVCQKLTALKGWNYIDWLSSKAVFRRCADENIYENNTYHRSVSPDDRICCNECDGLYVLVALYVYSKINLQHLIGSGLTIITLLIFHAQVQIEYSCFGFNDDGKFSFWPLQNTLMGFAILIGSWSFTFFKP